MNKHFISLLLPGAICFNLNSGQAQCSFSVSQDDPCASQEVTLSVDDPEGGATYGWDLDQDGQPEITGVSIDHAFPELHIDSTYSIILFEDGSPCDTQAITVLAVPDASIGVPPGIVILTGNSLKACNGSSSFDLSIFNASATYSSNVSYVINWGDGSPPEQHTNATFSNTGAISHTYNGLGYYTIFISATHQSGCVFTNNYTFYNGGNPSVGVAIPGNTVGLCAPATLEFPITNTAGNPPGTEYTVYISGVEVAHYTQDELPPSFIHTFLESSCGQVTSTGNYQNAFDIRIVASNPCNSSTATIEPIEISEPPEPSFDILAPAFSCEGAVYGFENTTANISEVIAGNPSECIDVLNPTWTITGTSGEDWNVVSGNLFGSNNIQIEFLTPGVYTITMTLVSFACGPVSISQQITIYEPPGAGADISVPDPGGNAGGGCTPLTIPFNNASNGELLSYHWSISPDEGWAFADSTDANSVSPVVDFTIGGFYDITLTVSNPCAEVTWDTTLLLPGPPAVNLDPVPDFCESATLSFDASALDVQLNGSATAAYQWSFPGANTESSDEPFPSGIQYDAPGTYIIELTVANDCGSTTVQDTFVVQQPTSLDMPPDVEVCSGDEPFQLQATPSGGAWSGTGISSNGTFDPASASIGINTLTYTYGVGACFVQDVMAVTVIQAAAVSAGPDVEVCSNVPPVQLSGTPANGAWTGSDGAALSGNTFLPADSGPGVYTLTYSFTDGNNCTSSDALNITVNAAPAIAVADSSYCNTPGATPLPAATPASGQWSGPGVVDANAGMFDPVVAGGAGSYTLTYSVQGTNGCNSTEPVQIGVIDPAAVTAGNDAVLCISDAPYNLGQSASPAGGVWTSSSAGLSGNTFNPSVAGGGTHTLTYHVGAGSCAVEDAIQIEVFDPGPVSAGPDLSLCLDDAPVSLSGHSPSGGVWSGTGLSGESFNPASATLGTHTLTYTITGGPNGCQKSDTRVITVNPLPEAAFSLPDIACIEEGVQLENQSSGAVDFTWDFGDGGTSQDENPSHAFSSTGNFTVFLTAANEHGCDHTIFRALDIAAPPQAQFSPDIEQGCGGLEVNLANESFGLDTYFYWDFGNGMSSTMPEPDFAVPYQAGMNDTTYIVTLTAQNLCGTDTFRDTLLVKAFPVVEFGFTVSTGCAPLTLAFANISTGSPDSYFWDFGNGHTSIDSLPAPQIFEGDTTVVDYTITLIAANDCGADTLSRVLTVEPAFVTAFFNTSSTLGCAPFTVDFANFSTTGTNVSWDFGDGNIVSVENPSHTFQSPGVYEVTLYAANTCAEDEASIEIEVLASPEVSFEYSPNLCTGQEIQFTNTSTGLAGSFWIFGPGDSSTLTNPVHQFEAPGTYTVTLTGISPATACSASSSHTIEILEAPSAVFEPINAVGCTPLTVSFSNLSAGGDYFQWDFGDGNTSVQADPAHTFIQPGNYSVSLTVSNPAGCRADTVVSGIFAYPVPAADFDIQKEQACGLPVNVVFQNLSEGAEGFNWDLGLPAGSSLADPAQVYTEPGEYDVLLVVSNQYGCADTARQSMILYDSPISDFALDSARGCQPVTVSFANYSRGNRFFWDFGDGYTSTERQPIHMYSEPGLYAVTLTVAYDDLCYDSLTLTGAVEVLKMPNAGFEWVEEQFNGATTGTIEFINTSEQADLYKWDFGDGTYSDEEHPVHRYYENGAWQVLLTALTHEGCRDDTLVVVLPQLIKGLHVPNAFAPEQGSDDARVFLPKGIGLKEYQVQIFSAYGELLWQSTLLRNGSPAEGWDGVHNGSTLPQDVYVWKIKAVFEDESEWRGTPNHKQRFEKMGSVTLIR